MRSSPIGRTHHDASVGAAATEAPDDASYRAIFVSAALIHIDTWPATQGRHYGQLRGGDGIEHIQWISQ
jgi:hypothetical protein